MNEYAKCSFCDETGNYVQGWRQECLTSIICPTCRMEIQRLYEGWLDSDD